jgi:hypothetical protein
MLYKINFRTRSNTDETHSRWVRFATDRTEAVTRFMDWFFKQAPDDAVRVEEVMEVSLVGDMSAIEAIDDATVQP